MPEPIRAPVRPQAAQVYQLKRALAALPDDLRLRNHEWGVLFAVTGEHSCAQIASALGLSPEERDRVFGRLAAFGLIEERPLSYGEYLRALSSCRDDQPKPLAAFLRGGAAMPPARQPQPSPPPPSPPKPSPAPAFLPLELPVAAPVPPAAPRRRGALSLKALMQVILGKAGDRQAGQLDIYRVFIRINTKLLQKNGITTLRFEEDRLIDDPELQGAIAASVEKALGFSCPAEVYV